MNNQDFLIYADTLLNHVAKPAAILDIPWYYKDPVGNDAAKKACSTDSSVAHTLALAYKITNNEKYLNKSADIITQWSLINKGAANNDATLNLPLKFEKFIAAAEFMGYYWPGRQKFVEWLIEVYCPACNNIKYKFNNWGIIGLTGLVHAHKHLESSLLQGDISLLKEKIKSMICTRDSFIGKKYELWTENLRNNSGMWYYYFCLSPFIKALYLVDSCQCNLLPSLANTIEIFYQYCQHPETWPYKKLTVWPFSMLQQLLFPSADEVEIMGPNEFWIAAGHLYNNAKWSAYGQDTASGSNYWPWIALEIDNLLI